MFITKQKAKSRRAAIGAKELLRGRSVSGSEET